MIFRAVIQSLGFAIPNIQKNNVFAGLDYQQELLKTIKAHIKKIKGSDAIGEERGRTIFEAGIDHNNFLSELQEYAASIDESNVEEIYKGNQQTRFNHLIEIRNNIGIYLPTFFFFPLRISIKQNTLPIFIGSVPKLYTELQEIGTMLKAQEKMKLNIEDRSFIAGEEDLEDYEANYEGMKHFWASFSFLIMDNLVKKSQQSKLPIILWSL